MANKKTLKRLKSLEAQLAEAKRKLKNKIKKERGRPAKLVLGAYEQRKKKCKSRKIMTDVAYKCTVSVLKLELKCKYNCCYN